MKKKLLTNKKNPQEKEFFFGFVICGFFIAGYLINLLLQ